ncbi:MAG: VOC family protein [Pseudomonadota bacterium]
MLAYVTIGTNDLDKARAFYSTLMDKLGARPVVENERSTVWGNGPGKPMVMVCTPADGGEATFGNGTMFTLQCDSKELVDELHKIALDQGGANEGDPGLRANDRFYLAYARDLDGNKLAFFTPA